MEKKEYTAKELFELISRESTNISSQPFVPDDSIADIRNKILIGFNSQVFVEMERENDSVSYKRAGEKAINYYISTGNVGKIKGIIETLYPGENHYNPAAFIDVGQLSDNPLQQAISMFVCGITVYTRAALDGGLPDHIAYALSDNYIWYGIRLTNIM